MMMYNLLVCFVPNIKITLKTKREKRDRKLKSKFLTFVAKILYKEIFFRFIFLLIYDIFT